MFVSGCRVVLKVLGFVLKVYQVLSFSRFVNNDFSSQGCSSQGMSRISYSSYVGNDVLKVPRGRRSQRYSEISFSKYVRDFDLGLCQGYHSQGLSFLRFIGGYCSKGVKVCRGISFLRSVGECWCLGLPRPDGMSFLRVVVLNIFRGPQGMSRTTFTKYISMLGK